MLGALEAAAALLLSVVPVPVQVADSVAAPYDQIVSRLSAIAAVEPARVSVVDLTSRFKMPTTHDGRHIVAIRIGSQGASPNDRTLIVSGVHGHELGPPALALALAERFLVEGRTTRFGEVWIVPVLNPDGYEYSRVGGRYGRKNRGWADGGPGVDLNRNFPTGWGTSCGGSNDPKADDYRGPAPASEAEVRTLLAAVKHESFTRALDLHAWGQVVWWGGGCDAGASDPSAREAALRFGTNSKYQPLQPKLGGLLFQHLAAEGMLALSAETFMFTFDPPPEVVVQETQQLWPAVLAFAREPAPALRGRRRFHAVPYAMAGILILVGCGALVWRRRKGA